MVQIIQFQSKKNRNRNQTQNVMDPNNEDNYNSQETKKERGNRQQEKIHGNPQEQEQFGGWIRIRLRDTALLVST